MTRSTALVCAILAGALAVAALAGAATIPVKSFRLPDGGVHCVIAGGTAKQAGVICTATLAPGARPFPRASCHGTGDTGGAIALGLKGGPKGVCLSEDPFVRPIRLLAYGKRISIGGISCAAVSKSIGVRCENANARGFQLSSKGWKAVATTEG